MEDELLILIVIFAVGIMLGVFLGTP